MSRLRLVVLLALPALAVGDFDVGNKQHHGTPAERRDALLAGFETGDPATCNQYVV